LVLVGIVGSIACPPWASSIGSSRIGGCLIFVIRSVNEALEVSVSSEEVECG
jgi:hypothetical protein